ncbi:MAG: aminotransferase class III-fold pyridoxal phosphate-dependent enzyme, partial [Gammaproteobacteria bacterium]|nr:aminotransferase class III-fold pyridoxal phosphate-dependent enzyme [Gammaproteobacteria bacterium]
RELCTERGALLIIDEIQTGFCRTGKFFACEHFDLQPDMMTLAKAMGGGVPIGATMLSAHITVDPGLHGTTFGGNPLACAAALSAMEIFQNQKLAQRAEELGSYFESRFAEKQLSQVRTVRRLGLMIGIEIKHRAQDALALMLERKIVALPAGPNVIRLLPPLVIERSQLDRVVEVLHECLA